jgi:hypothetical protein
MRSGGYRISTRIPQVGLLLPSTQQQCDSLAACMHVLLVLVVLHRISMPVVMSQAMRRSASCIVLALLAAAHDTCHWQARQIITWC